METTPPHEPADGRPQSVRRPGDRLQLARRMGLVGRSDAIQQVVVSIVQIAPTNSTVLVTGETGTGKEVVARAIHDYSPRAGTHFVPLNVSALNEGTLESELFGHEKGAFTDAVRSKSGIFESAGQGTVFLDEIGDVTPAMQVRLLRVLEEREYRRVGGEEVLKAQARVIAATNRNLEHAVREGDFRADLYYRLHVFEIHLPPLRERKEDIPLLVEYFVERFAEDAAAGAPVVGDDAMALFVQYDWPGNVRELRTVVERMLVTAVGPVITADDVPNALLDHVRASRLLPALPQQSTMPGRELEIIYRTLLELRAEVHDLRRIMTERWGDDSIGKWIDHRVAEAGEREPSEQLFVDIEPAEENGQQRDSDEPATLKDLEREAIRLALESVNGNRREAARQLGIGERTLYRKLKDYGLS